MRVIAVAFLALVAFAAQAGEVYKWKDKDGRVHYGDRPKHGAQALDIPAAAPLDPAAEQAAADRAAECARKRKQLETYRNAPSISETDNLGRTREYSEAERQQLIALTEKKTNEACAPAPATAEASDDAAAESPQ
jgi:hypothetical protein